jgi:hypothetical protein
MTAKPLIMGREHWTRMPSIAHASFHQKSFRIPYHRLHSFFSQPAPAYRGE